MTGKKFEKLLVVSREPSKNGRAMWLCQCDCGNSTIVKGKQLLNGNTKSCGCLRKEVKIKHGKYNTRLYTIWRSMKQRCYNKNNIRYNDYGGRGIAVCDEWRNDFQAFYTWAVLHGYDNNLTIDRIDVNKDYEPNNCRWLTLPQQNRNTRRNRYFTINGVTKCLKDWCIQYNVPYSTVRHRLKQGSTIEEALSLSERSFIE